MGNVKESLKAALRRTETVNEPMIIKVLKDRIVDWSRAPGSNLLLHLKGMAPLTQVVIGRKHSLLFESTDVFAAHIPQKIPKEESKVQTFTRLVGFEVELEWRGILRSEPRFTNHSRLRRLSQPPSPLVVKDELVNRLNEDPELIRLIKAAKPKELTAIVTNPKEVFWVISGEVLLQRMVHYERNARAMLDILRLMAKHIRRVAQDTKKNKKLLVRPWLAPKKSS